MEALVLNIIIGYNVLDASIANPMSTSPSDQKAALDAQTRLRFIRRQLTDCTTDPFSCGYDVSALAKEKNHLERFLKDAGVRVGDGIACLLISLHLLV